MKIKNTRKFLKHLTVTNVYLFILSGIYNLFSWIIPLVRIRIVGFAIILLIYNLLLVSLKLINNFNLRAHW